MVHVKCSWTMIHPTWCRKSRWWHKAYGIKPTLTRFMALVLAIVVCILKFCLQTAFGASYPPMWKLANPNASHSQSDGAESLEYGKCVSLLLQHSACTASSIYPCCHRRVVRFWSYYLCKPAYHELRNTFAPFANAGSWVHGIISAVNDGITRDL